MNATAEKLAQALRDVAAPPLMIDLAERGYYDEMDSPLSMPLLALLDDARRYELYGIAQRVMDGEFNASDEEVDAWGQSREGQEAIEQYFKARGGALVGGK